MDIDITELQKQIKQQLILLIQDDTVLINGVSYSDFDATDDSKLEIKIEYTKIEK